MAACAMDPRMSCRHSRQSKETDSVNRATSADGPAAKRPLRDTGGLFLGRFNVAESAWNESESHAKVGQASRLPQYCARRRQAGRLGRLPFYPTRFVIPNY